jgi:hypothetical protein
MDALAQALEVCGSNHMTQFPIETLMKGQMEKANIQEVLPPWRGRSSRRFKLEFPVRLRFQSGSSTEEIEGVSKNLSIGGFLLRSAVSFPAHTPVTFVLTVHGKQALRPVHLSGEGEIVRTDKEQAEAGYVLAVKCYTPFTQLEQFLREEQELPT